VHWPSWSTQSRGLILLHIGAATDMAYNTLPYNFSGLLPLTQQDVLRAPASNALELHEAAYRRLVVDRRKILESVALLT
jgi:hypothetical protein